MALVPCVVCRQPFYASCHDASCTEALCPLCEYAEETDDATVGGATPPRIGDEPPLAGQRVPITEAASRPAQ